MGARAPGASSVTITIAIDAMGGDHGPSVTVPAALAFLRETPDARVILVGLADALHKAMAGAPPEAAARITLREASEVVAMDEPPADALRHKKDSSMRVAFNLVKSGEAHACVSAGNTGALMAIARFVLKTLPGIDRPAIASQLPTRKGTVTALDLGANVNCSPVQLVQFAAMGSALCSAVDGIERPTVGLLNIGEEDIKGNELVKETAELLKRSGLNFVGNVEGDDIFKGETDVVVCDGFVGNVTLKSIEGLAGMLSDFLKRDFMRNPLTKLSALIAYPVLRAFRRSVDPRRYNGATLIGLRGVVVKSHGGTDVFGFSQALRKAHTEVLHDVLDGIARRIAAMPAITAAPAASAQAAPDV
jgi:glycerol-3-phosphate acyltransferase PlsX